MSDIPVTIADLETATARVLARHYPRGDRRVCWCDAEWHPLHQAQELQKAGVLRKPRKGDRYL